MTTRFLLACDMDGTLFPVRRDPRHPRAVIRFQRLLATRPDLVLAYVTGRSLLLAQQAIEEWHLPWPDFLCTDVGTAIHRRYGDRWQEDGRYRQLMTDRMCGLTGDDVRELLEGTRYLEPQDPSRQSPFKASYELPSGPVGSRTAEWARRSLQDLGYDLSFVLSHDVYGHRLLLDILPREVDKGTAVDYLQGCLGLADEQVVYCGDGLNDLGAMQGNHRVVLPANADPRLRRALREAGCFGGDRPRCLLSQLPHLWGVLDGCRHFGIDAEQ